MSPGEYAVRGGLIDLFPMGSPVPYRVDLFGDEVDSIRTFDPDTQRSLYPVPEVRLLPGREFPMDEAARTAFRARWREQLEGDPTKMRIYKDIGAGIATAGIEYYLPLFFDQTATIFDYLGAAATLVLHGEVDEALQRFWTDTRERHRFLQHDPRAADPAARGRSSCAGGVLHAAATRMPRWRCAASEREAVALGAPAARPRASTAARPSRCSRLQRPLATTPHRVLIVAESEGRRESLLDLLRDHHIEPPSVATLAEFEAGDEHFAIAAAPLAAGLLLAARRRRDARDPVRHRDRALRHHAGARRRRKQEQVSDVDALIKDLSELKVGDPVVHVNHGIGRYRGLVNIDLGGTAGPSEFLHLEYADKATLYVPVAQLHLIGRYTGVSADEAPLHKLGSGQWDKARRKAAEQVRDTAAELLNLYARRAAREGYAFRFAAARLRGVRGELRLRGDARPARRDPRGDPGHGQPAADGPAGLRRCRLRQDRGRAARRLRRGHRRQAGRDAGADHAAGRAALPDHRRPLRQVAGQGGRAVALPLAEGSQRGARRPRRRHDRHRRRHAQAAVSRRQVQAPGPARDRRGAPLRRAPQGGDQGDARRGRRADAHRHADPAHARHGARRPARPVRDRHRAAAPPGDQDLRAQRGQRHDPRGGAARAEARRPGLLPAQRGRDDRAPARQAAGAAARGAHRASRTARCPSASSSA